MRYAPHCPFRHSSHELAPPRRLPQVPPDEAERGNNIKTFPFGYDERIFGAAAEFTPEARVASTISQIWKPPECGK